MALHTVFITWWRNVRSTAFWLWVQKHRSFIGRGLACGMKRGNIRWMEKHTGTAAVSQFPVNEMWESRWLDIISQTGRISSRKTAQESQCLVDSYISTELWSVCFSELCHLLECDGQMLISYRARLIVMYYWNIPKGKNCRYTANIFKDLLLIGRWDMR